MSRPAPVWITGISACTPLGNSFDEVARGLLAGTPAVHRVQGIAVDDHPSRIGGQVPWVPCPEGHDPAPFAALPRLGQVVRFCRARAVRAAGLWDARHERRIGIVLGLGAEWHQPWEQDAVRCGDMTRWEPRPDERSMVER